ncbi:MAG: FHA domain-containing protein, partial [Vicinamibacterales bacterium]
MCTVRRLRRDGCDTAERSYALAGALSNMAWNVLLTTAQGTRSYPISERLAIGRAQDNDVQLDDPNVSRHHALLQAGSDGPVFVDLGSANGSRVNGRAVEPRVPVQLRAKDLIEIADFKAQIFDDSATVPPAHPLSEGALWPAARAQTGSGGTVMLNVRPRLQVRTATGEREVELEADEVTLGRSLDNSIVVDSAVVSRHHLVLRRAGATYAMEALDTPNGVTVGGVRVRTHVLNDGDILSIGGEVLLRFLIRRPAEMAVTERPLQLLPGKPITVGRSPDCDLHLEHPAVSQRHARITTVPGGGHVIEDLGSTNGTFVNGVALHRGEQRSVGPNDVIQVGPLSLRATERGIRSVDHSRDIRLTAVMLSQHVTEKLNLLHDISLVIEPQEFVTIVGASGAGKSTLLGALSGLRPATDGDVLLNGTSLYTNFEAYRTNLGYVPQDDILHRELPVGRALGYAAELRLPEDTTATERRTRIDAVIEQLALRDRRPVPISSLSGGERKRVSIGAELLTQPGLFFLDEATSGLDPGTEGDLMRLLRTLADDGRTVVLVTHATKNVMLCDQVIFLAKGGHLAFFGPPDQALAYFGVEDFDEIYRRLASEASPEEWAARYTKSEQFARYVTARLSTTLEDSLAPADARSSSHSTSNKKTVSSSRQLFILSRRYFDIMKRDRVNLALMFVLAPALGLVNFVAWPADILTSQGGSAHRSMSMFFLTAIVPFLVGSLSAVREIVKESAIFRRERAVCLGIGPYLASKIAIALLFSF